VRYVENLAATRYCGNIDNVFLELNLKRYIQFFARYNFNHSDFDFIETIFENVVLYFFPFILQPSRKQKLFRVT